MRHLAHGKNGRGADIPPLEHRFVAHSRQMQEISRLIRQFADSNSPLVIQGATGTGKEVIAREIHQSSQRSGGPFVIVDCPNIPDSLFESELFGYESGSFTGSGGGRGRPGLCELADEGILVLDEIADMPLTLQIKLLRLVEQGVIWRVGGRSPIRLDVRIIALAQQPLELLVAKGRFRSDLWHRLNVFRIDVPPLCERKDDILPLFECFLKGDPIRAKPLTEEAQQALLAHDWPGNVRELRNATTRALWSSAGNMLIPEDFGLSGSEQVPPVVYANKDQWRPLADIDRDAREHVTSYIKKALDACGGNIAATARLLGTSREALSSRIGRRTDKKGEGNARG